MSERYSIAELRDAATRESPPLLLTDQAKLLALVEAVEAAERARAWGYVTQELVDALAAFTDLPVLPTRERLEELTRAHRPGSDA